MDLFLNILAGTILFELAMLCLTLTVGHSSSFWDDFFAAHIITGLVGVCLLVVLAGMWAFKRIYSIT